MSRAQEIIDRFAARRPFAVRLAEAVSLAVLVDPPLLRKARLDLVPGADPGTEADLWLSPLAQTRSPDGIVFSNEIAEALRSRLATDAARLDRAWRITQAMHRHLTPPLRLEEEIAWLSVSSDPGAADRIEELLRSALAALVMGERRGLAHWAARALPKLPSRARVTETARMLEAGAHLRLRGDARSLDADEETLDWLSWVAPADLPRVTVGVRRFPDAIELDARPEPAGQKLLLPQTDPLLVDLSWHDPEKSVRSGLQVTFRQGEVQKVPVSAEDVRLRTILGEVYDLRAAGTAPPSLRDWIIDFSEERARHRPFFGREEEQERIQEEIRTAKSGKLILVTGEVGAGKTALLANLIGPETLHHFFRRGHERLEDIAAAERSLIAQIAQLFPQVASQASHLRLPELLLEVINRKLSDSLIMVLDAVDEARFEDGEGLLALVPANIPEQLIVLASMKTGEGLNEGLNGGLKLPDSGLTFLLADPEPSLRKYWSRYLRRESVESFVRLSAGSFGVAQVVRSWIGPKGGMRTDRSALVTIWESLATQIETSPRDAVLGILAASYEPLPFSLLSLSARTDSFPRVLYPLVRVQETTPELLFELGEEVLRGFIASQLDLAYFHGRLAIAAEGAIFNGNSTAQARRYGLRHTADHWLAAGQPETALRLLTRVDVLTARCRELGVSAVCQGLRRWLVIGETSWISAILEILTERAIEIESRPEDLPTLLYSHLRAQGLDPGTIQDLLQSPEAPPLRLAQPFPGDGLHRRPPVSAPVRHRGTVTGCAFIDVDGPAVLSWSTDGTLRLWDVTKGELRTILAGHHGAVTACLVLDDGRAISASHTLRIWDLRTGSLEHTLRGHEGRVLGLLALDRRRVASWSRDCTLRVWDLENGRQEYVLSGHEGAVTACAATPDDRYLISGSEDATVRHWDLSSGKCYRVDRGHKGPVTGISIREEADYFLSVSQDGTIRVGGLEEPDDEDRPAVLEAHKLGILGCSISPDDSCFATWSYDRTVRLWRLSPYEQDRWAESRPMYPLIQPLATLTGHESAVLSCAFLSEGNRIVSCSADRSARIWDVETRESVAVLLGHDAAVRVVDMGFRLGVYSPHIVTQREEVVTASDDRTLRVWSMQGKEEATLDGDNETLFCLPFQDRRRVLTFSRFGDLRIHHLGESTPQWVGSASMAVGGGVLAPDDRRLILWSESLMDGKVQFTAWDLVERREIASFYAHDGPVLAAVTPDSKTLVTASMDGSIRHWSLVNWLEMPAVKGMSPVSALAASASLLGLFAFAGDWDGTTVLWLLNRGLNEAWFTGHTDRVLACALSSDDTRAVSASADQTLRLWDLREGISLAVLKPHTARAVLKGHTADVTGCAFTRDGTRIVSRSKDGRLGLWDGESGELVAFAEGHTDWVNAFAIAEDEGVVYSVSEDQTVRVWDLATGEPRGVVYGVSPFRSLAAVAGGVYAGDEAGNLWVLEYASGRPSPA
ncbi:MAG TPA: AAA family ATPase [Thermoanaerobaculia bacterium]